MAASQTPNARPYVIGVTPQGMVPTIVDVHYDYKTGERSFGAYSIPCESYEQRDALIAQILDAGDLGDQMDEFDRLRAEMK